MGDIFLCSDHIFTGLTGQYRELGFFMGTHGQVSRL